MIRKKLLIIGGSKFIGKSFINYFNFNKRYKNFEIILILRGSIQNFKSSRNIKIINQDFEKIKFLPDCDFILYCLRADSLKKDNELFKTFKKKILKFKDKPKIIFTSSGVIYGLNGKKKKIKEENKKIIYDYSQLKKYKKKWFLQKSNLEKKFLELSEFKIKVIILRMFSFLGPSILGLDYAPSKFFKSIKNNEKIFINGPLNTYRSYLDEKDMVEWIIKIFLKFNKKFEIYNFGSENSIKIYDLAIKMYKRKNLKKIVLINKSSKIDFYVPSVKKLKDTFKLKEKMTLKKSIKLLLKK